MLANKLSQMLVKVIAGEPEAGAWLYDTFAPRLYRLLYQRYGPDGVFDPDDLVQDAFIFFLQNQGKVLRDFLDQYPESDHTESGLLRRLWELTRGVVANKRRYLKTHGFSSFPELLDVASTENLEQDAIRRELIIRLDACLKKKKTRIYLYYKLRYHDGLTPQEIVQVTGWSQKAVYKLKDHLNEAVRHCAQKMGLLQNGEKER